MKNFSPAILTWAAAALSAGVAAIPAEAHTPYLLPNTFAVTKDHVSLQAALTEDIYFAPEIPVRATSYQVTGPTGAATAVDTVIMAKDMAIVEVPTPVDGTYRISTGGYVARTTRTAKIDGRWRFIRPARGPGAGGPAGGPGSGAGAPMPQAAAGAAPGAQQRANARPEGPPRFIDEAALPAGAEIVETKGIMTSEAFVTKGAPNAAALATKGQGLELKPTTHPNEIYLDGGFGFEMQLDGKPLPNLHLTVYRGGNTYEDRKIAAELKSGPDGRATLALDKPGAYLMTASYPGRRQEGEAPAERSYVYTLTFEVLQ